MTDTIQSIDYNEASEELRRQIAALQHRVWPDVCTAPKETIPDAHGKEFHARSFFIYADGKLASYAGVVCKTIMHEGKAFKIAGLSSVATDPEYQGRGLGSCTVSGATQWIEQTDTDFGIFTCEPSLARFYEQAGSWQVAPDVILVGSHDEDALSSNNLPVVVLMSLLSEKAKGCESILRHTSIYLDLPVGKFL
ncbi:GNAT family N-acetyltransferase [Paenibacillus dakarensis]|uniref:GNAT family N-acetyltransferase n=1 Tax=Paenibacillus dakarensis TaxID=1527293 RepID=UPI0009EA134A|nr:GNAT family N-acetyltransferase [Paenibacillus dakarensis]